jgi:cytochrome P450
MDEEGSLRKESQIKFPAFHAGPRVCLGQNLATQEAVSVMTLLVREFDFEMMPGQEITYLDSVTLPMKNGLKFRVKGLS